MAENIVEIHGKIKSKIFQNITNFAQNEIKLNEALLPDIRPLWTRLKISEPSASVKAVSAISTHSDFQFKGSLSVNKFNYDYSIRVAEQYGRIMYDFTASLKADIDSPVPLDSIFPLPQVYAADVFYGMPLDMYTDINITRYDIQSDTLANDNVNITIGLKFGEDCPFRRRYEKFLPDMYGEVIFTGTADNAFNNPEEDTPEFEIHTDYRGTTGLPILEIIPVKDSVLTISHLKDKDESGEEYYRNSAVWQGRIELPAPLKDIWVSYELFSHAQAFRVKSEFGDKGLKMSDIFSFIAALSGQTDMYEFPDWFVLKDLALKSIVFDMYKDIGFMRVYPGLPDDKLIGVGFEFIFPVPSIPIPFFDRAEGDPNVNLNIYWGNLDIGGDLSVNATFSSEWKGYTLLLGLSISDLEFEARLQKEKIKPPSIFPGFGNLVVEDVYLIGSIRNSSYYFSFYFADAGGNTLPIGQLLSPKIDWIEGSAFYTPYGAGLGLSMGFTLFEAGMEVSGAYEYAKDNGGHTLTLEGGIYTPLDVAKVIDAVLGTSISSDKLKIQIRYLYFKYTAQFSGDSSQYAVISANDAREFLFECEIYFKWDVIGVEIASRFELAWKETAAMKITASIQLFGFLAVASFSVSIKNGDVVFGNPKFMLSFRNMQVTAEQYTENNHIILKFAVKNLNLGELIEGLFDLLLPGESWYLPWPFQILKRISIKKLEITIDKTDEKVTASIEPNLKILFFEVKKVIITYSAKGNEKFMVELDIPLLELSNSSDTGRLYGNSGLYGMDLLGKVFPPIPQLGKSVFNLQFLAVGQHIYAEIPKSFEEKAIDNVLGDIKKSLEKDGRPRVDMNNNWIAAIELELISSISVKLLMCDPNFYGLYIGINNKSDITKPLAGLKALILYSKITENIGMFYARLVFPDRLRNIELGALQIRLGEVAVEIYTNGNFKIDFGFPHNRDFSRSFGLTYGIFTGSGGFYFGVLNGDTSQRVPKAKSGHFETVIELGIGISAGVGRTISMGPLKAGASIQITAIFEGVFASYIAEQHNNNQLNEPNNALSNQNRDEMYYCVKAAAGIVAYIYGEVDFVVIKISFSINLSVWASVKMESHEPTILDISVDIKVSASIKIFFIKINFSFKFKWSHTFTFGERTPAPWNTGTLQAAHYLKFANEITLKWKNGKIRSDIGQIYAEIVPYFSIDGVTLNGQPSGNKQYKTAFLPFLHGFEKPTINKLFYADALDETPFYILAELFLARALLSLEDSDLKIEDAGELVFEYSELKALADKISQYSVFDEGFTLEQISNFIKENLKIIFISSEENIRSSDNIDGNNDIQGIAFPMPPVVSVTWDNTSYDLSSTPAATDQFIENIKRYYDNLGVDEYKPRYSAITLNNSQATSVTAYIFRDYFHLLTQTSLSQILPYFSEDDANIKFRDILNTLKEKSVLSAVSGMTSKFLLGGLRVPAEKQSLMRALNSWLNADTENSTESLYTVACQQFNSSAPVNSDEIVNRFEMKVNDGCEWLTLQNSISGRLFGLGRNCTAGTLVWKLTGADLKYPEDKFSIAGNLYTAPYYSWRPVTIELKTPDVVANPETETQSKTIIYETGGALPDEFYLEIIDENNEPESKNKNGVMPKLTSGFLVYIPLSHITGDIYSIGCLCYENIGRINTITANFNDKDNISAYRHSTEFDETEDGFITLDSDDIFIFRSNLSLEPEKPLARNTFANESVKNTALLNENKTAFLNILKDAGLVNSRGYYLKCVLPDYALDDGNAEIALWIPCEKNPEAVMLEYDSFTQEDEKKHPVIVTREQSAMPLYKQGNAAFVLEKDVPVPDTTEELFQMLKYKIKPNEYFFCGTESMPLNGQTAGDSAEETDKWIYSQVIPVSRFLTDNAGDPDNPYRGLVSVLKLGFSFLDVLGNQTSEGLNLDINYGYTDPLISPSAYPHTQCFYGVEETERGKFLFKISFVYKPDDDLYSLTEEQKESEKEILRYAYWQLNQSDRHITLEAEIMNQKYRLDKEKLVEYLGKLYYDSGVDENISVGYEQVIAVDLDDEKTETETEIGVKLYVTRNKDYLAKDLKDKKESELVLRTSFNVSANDNEIKGGSIAKDAKNDKLYILKTRPVSFGKVFYGALAPLSKELISLSNIEVRDIDGKTVYPSFHNIDLETWMDIFLQDFEFFISPNSKLTDKKYAAELENLMALKEQMANALAQGVKSIVKTELSSEEYEKYRKKTAECYKAHMLLNLYTGRLISAVAAVDVKTELSEKYSYIGTVKENTESIDLAETLDAAEKSEISAISVGKIKDDKLITFSFKPENIAKQKNLTCNLNYILTDWEKCAKIQNRKEYNYLTLLEPVEATLSLSVPLPYRRYPDLPVLIKHETGVDAEIRLNEDGYFRWIYNTEFSHSCAAQDTIYVKLLFETVSARNSQGVSLPQTLAAYIYNRTAVLNAVSSESESENKKGADNLISLSQNILASLSKKRSAIMTLNNNFTLSLSIEKYSEKSFAVNGDNSDLVLSLRDTVGEWCELIRIEPDIFTIPENIIPAEPYVFNLSFVNMDIRTQNAVNTQVHIIRNQNISDIDSGFVFTTPSVSFTNLLKPCIRYDKLIFAGKWEQSPFVEFFSDIAKSFTGFSLEIMCRRLVTLETYSAIPIMNIPLIHGDKDNIGEELKNVYAQVNDWLSRHINTSFVKTADIQIYASFHIKNRSVSELTNVIFNIFNGEG